MNVKWSWETCVMFPEIQLPYSSSFSLRVGKVYERVISVLYEGVTSVLYERVTSVLI